MTTKEMTAAELYAINLNENEPSFYAQIPGVIFHCTYITTEAKKGRTNYGKKVRKKLSPHAIVLYTLLKQIAGKKSASWVNTDHLAEMSGMSKGKLSEAKKELMTPIEQLNGKCLIQVTTKKKRFTKPDGSNGATLYHHITPTHIWPENNAYMSTVKYQLKLPIGPISSSQCESEHPSSSQCEPALPGTSSQCELNKTENKNPSVNEQEPALRASGCSSSDRNLCADYQKKIAWVKKAMKESGSDDNFIREMTRKYTPQRILDAGFYVRQMAKRKNIPNKQGYFRRAIEDGRKWEFQET